MSCIHNIWNCYCKVKEEVIDTPCSPLCKNYCAEETSMKNIFNKGPATDTNCACNKSTADNDYITLLEKFINKMHPENNYGLFGMTPHQAETHVDNNMRYLGYNNQKITDVYREVVRGCYCIESIIRLDFFVRQLLSQPHKDYEIPVKELTIKQIEDLLGYKIKIVGEH